LNNKTKINITKGKMYFTIVALAAVLMMSFNMNANMNSNMNAYATIIGDIQGADDIGQSLECVIVVVGCDGTGSVGSSGDTIIGSNNGNDDNNTNGGDTPLPPIPPAVCEQCIGELSVEVQADIAVALGLAATATAAEICIAIDALATVEALVLVLGEAGLSAEAIVDLLACLDIDISLDAVIAILL
jgi:hypothetical protein